GSDALARYLGPNVLVVRGRYVGPSEGGLVLSVESVESRRGNILRWAGETVVVRGVFARSVEQREASWSKTALLAGMSTVGLVVACWAFGPGSGGRGGVGWSSGPIRRSRDLARRSGVRGNAVGTYPCACGVVAGCR